MSLIEKLLRDSSDFLQEVSMLTTTWVRELNVERSREIVEYYPLNDGHMLRPLLVYLTACAMDKNMQREVRDRLITLAASVELMHNASLLHDDLLDNEASRRGKPCVQQVYGFNNALLAGNIYYIKAIGLCNHSLERTQTQDLLNTALTMCEGEILQAAYENIPMTQEVYERVIRCKTGSLMALACRQTAVIMKAEVRTITLFGQLGSELGLMYQLRDDRKDKDALVEGNYDDSVPINSCNDRIRKLLEELSQEHNISQFKDIVKYFKG